MWRRLGKPLYESVLPRKWSPPRQHLVEHTAEAVDVGTGVDAAIAQQLLRAHVRGGSRTSDPGPRELPDTGNVDRSGDSKISHDRVIAGEKNVLRFDVPVDDSLFVRI